MQRGGALRVAVLFYGRINAYEKVLDGLNRLKERYAPTFFCSLNRPKETPYIKKFMDTFGMTKEQYALEPTVVPDYFTKCRKNEESQYLNTYSLFYHLNKAYELVDKYQKAHGRPFDIIIAYRADIQTGDTIPLQPPKLNTIYIPKGSDYGGISGMMAYGSPDSMKKYCSVLNHLMEYCNKVSINHEVLLKAHLEAQQLNIERFSFPFSLHPDRQNAQYEQLGGARLGKRRGMRTKTRSRLPPYWAPEESG